MLRVSPKKMESEEMKDTAMLTRLFYPGHRKRYRASREEEDGRRRSSIEEKWSIESPQVQLKVSGQCPTDQRKFRAQAKDSSCGCQLWWKAESGEGRKARCPRTHVRDAVL